MFKLLAAATLTALIASPALSATLTATAVSDLTVSDSDNDGIMDSALASNDGFIRVFGSGNTQRGVWEYDLSGVDAGSTINSVSVKFEDRGTTRNGLVSLFGYVGNGIAEIADGNNTLTQIGSFSFGADNSDLDYNVSLSSTYLQSIFDAGASYFGIVMVSSDENFFGPGGDICSIETTYSLCAGTTGSQLTVDSIAAVPLPASLPLLMGGLGLLGWAGRRRKKTA